MKEAFMVMEGIGAVAGLQGQLDGWKACQSEGMTAITLPEADAEEMIKIAYDETWELVLTDDPVNGPIFQELTTNK